MEITEQEQIINILSDEALEYLDKIEKLEKEIFKLTNENYVFKRGIELRNLKIDFKNKKNNELRIKNQKLKLECNRLKFKLERIEKWGD